jgi:hypothetical protein
VYESLKIDTYLPMNLPVFLHVSLSVTVSISFWVPVFRGTILIALRIYSWVFLYDSIAVKKKEGPDAIPAVFFGTFIVVRVFPFPIQDIPECLVCLNPQASTRASTLSALTVSRTMHKFPRVMP